MKLSRLLASGFIVCAFSQAYLDSVRAELILDFTSIELTPRNTGFVDVFARSSNGAAINVAGFDLSFRIVDVSPTGQPASGQVFFLDSFNHASSMDLSRQSNSEQSLSNYIFSGTTRTANFASARQNPTITSLAQGDSTFNPSNSSLTNVPVTNPTLIARLEIGQTQSADTVLARGEYEIRLVSARFYNADDADASTFRVGQIGTASVSAIPEPNSLALGAIAAFFALGMRRGRRR